MPVFFYFIAAAHFPAILPMSNSVEKTTPYIFSTRRCILLLPAGCPAPITNRAPSDIQTTSQERQPPLPRRQRNQHCEQLIIPFYHKSSQKSPLRTTNARHPLRFEKKHILYSPSAFSWPGEGLKARIEEKFSKRSILNLHFKRSEVFYAPVAARKAAIVDWCRLIFSQNNPDSHLKYWKSGLS